MQIDLHRVWLFPFKFVKPDSEIILYGFGNVGKEYLAQIQATHYCKVKYIVDRDYKKFQGLSVPVYNPEVLNVDHVGLVVIALGRDVDISDAEKMLLDMGYKKDQIVAKKSFYSLYRLQTPSIEEKAEVVYFTRQEAIEEYGELAVNHWEGFRGLLKVYRAKNQGFCRMGQDYDGGYLMLDDMHFDGEKIAYSFGINNDISWDTDMTNAGWHVFMYDHTIDDIPEHRDEFHFHKLGIADSNEHGDDVSDLVSIINKNNHTYMQHMVLKMDVEGAEYGFLNMTDSNVLTQFDQIVMELHGLLNNNNWQEKKSALEKLTKTHAVIHIHGNNFAGVVYVDGIPYPDALEITLVNRNNYDLYRENNVVLPNDLDMPCCWSLDEIPMSRWNE